MLTTRGVIAIFAVIVFFAALLALRSNASRTADWLLAFGTGLGTVWSLLSMYWAETHASMAPVDGYLSLTLMGVVTTIYFTIRARARVRVR